jgi:hypothetical protein
MQRSACGFTPVAGGLDGIGMSSAMLRPMGYQQVREPWSVLTFVSSLPVRGQLRVLDSADGTKTLLPDSLRLIIRLPFAEENKLLVGLRASDEAITKY